MKQIIVMMAAVVLVGYGEEIKTPERKPIAPGRKLEWKTGDAPDSITRVYLGQSAGIIEKAFGQPDERIQLHREVKASPENRGEVIHAQIVWVYKGMKVRSPSGKILTTVRFKIGFEYPKEGKPRGRVFGVVVELPVEDPIVEKAVRESLEKPEGILTVADLEKVTSLRLPFRQITDVGLKEVAKLQNLEKLYLEDTKVTTFKPGPISRAGALKPVPRRMFVDSVTAKITDAGLKELAKLEKLEYLDLNDTKITDAGLKEVAKLQKLKELNLYNNQITDAGLKELAKLQKLESLNLSSTQVTDAGLKELAKLQKLEYLWLSNTQITDAGLKELAKLQKLEYLWLSNTQITKAGWAELKKALPNLAH